MEDNLTIEELNAILDAARKQEHDRRAFAAALKGVDYNKAVQADDEESDPFTRAVNAAKEQLTGKSTEQLEFEDIGIGVESWDEE